MAAPESPRRLIVNADDFGRSLEINAAVVQAHREGILTTASLMVNEPAAADAVERARRLPRLGVGLHLVLAAGRATLPPRELPRLVDATGAFTYDPVRAGLRYFLHPDWRAELRREIDAQCRSFRATGLPLDHLNGHVNLHLHPVILGLLTEGAEAWGVRAIRLTRDRFWLNARLASGHWLYRVSHAVIFNLLSTWARRALARRRVRHTRHVFGLLQNGRVDEAFVLRLLARLPDGDSELYSHPSLTDFRHEFEALVSPGVRRVIVVRGIQLIRYQDL